MAVAYDNVGPSSAGQGGTAVASITWSHTVSSILGGSIVVSANLGAATTAMNSYTLSATCGGVAMTSLGKVQSGGATAGYLQLFGILNQAMGAKTIVVTASGAPTSLTGGSVSFTGVGAFGTAVAASGNSTAATVSVNGTSTGNMVVAGCCAGSPISAVSGSGTSRWLKNTSGGSGAGEGAQATAPSVASGSKATLGYTLTTDYWGMLGIELMMSTTGPNPSEFFPFFM